MASAIDLRALLTSLAPMLAGPPQTDEAVGNAFHRAMASIARFDHVVVFAYQGQARPIDLYSTFSPRDYHVFVTLYQAGPYLLDPFFHASIARRTGLLRMGELAPDRFFQSEYFRNYYSQTELAEEIGFFVPLARDAGVVLSLMRRREHRAFSRAEMALLAQAVGFVRVMTESFWGGVAKRFAAAPGVNPPQSAQHTSPDRYHVLHLHDLTRREGLIVDLVLQGHSSESIGRRLGISTGTVKVHRRNVYRKLNISSQTQLLSLYLREHEARPVA